jgi:hypothetical protein
MSMKYVAAVFALLLTAASIVVVLPAGYLLGWGTYGTALVQWSTLLLVGLVLIGGFKIDGPTNSVLHWVNDQLTWVVTIALPLT